MLEGHFKFTLNGHGPDFRARIEKRVATNVAILPKNDEVAEIIGSGNEGSRVGIKAKGDVEVDEVHAVLAKANAAIASSGWIQARSAVVDGDSLISQRWEVVEAREIDVH